MELIKYYDILIFYHLGKANVVVDALIQKRVSMGSLAIFELLMSGEFKTNVYS